MSYGGMNEDFIGFTFNGVHSLRELNIYRTSTSNRYEQRLAPNLTDKTAAIEGADGTRFFRTQHKDTTFTLNIAFDNVTEAMLRKMKQLFNGKQLAELIFDETPYKAYLAKVTGTPKLNVVPFAEETKYTMDRVYRGEGSIQFTCYHPYAHTPDWVWAYGEEGIEILKDVDGRLAESYPAEVYQTIAEWLPASGLYEKGYDDRVDPRENVVNYGDIDAPFIVTKNAIRFDNEETEKILKIGEFEIVVKEECDEFTWDSNTGLVTGKIDGIIRPIEYSGTSYCAIPANGEVQKLVNIAPREVAYRFWYY